MYAIIPVLTASLDSAVATGSEPCIVDNDDEGDEGGERLGVTGSHISSFISLLSFANEPTSTAGCCWPCDG